MLCSLFAITACKDSTDKKNASLNTIMNRNQRSEKKEISEKNDEDKRKTDKTDEYVTSGKKEYRGFSVDNVLHTKSGEAIHYNVYIPKGYDGNEAYALYFTLPGYQGLYFQGVAENIRTEEFGFEAQKYNDRMIVVAPQLEDWGETSANETIELVEYFLQNYNIDTKKVYAIGYSGGGETMSLVMGKKPELFTAYLQCSSKWDGAYDKVVKSRTPVYSAVGENDEYYGSQPSKKAYNTLRKLYREQGLSNKEIGQPLF
ncbi:prolyl oligopeptidase family serine peptidase [Clostridium felsineum]|uniref:prolyl oligopeptidase family serine peptidase n=1 Tax=Clostridium felsineum TaxID=36839 RepID=UPI002033EE8B|nr:prolyl oligopeptidase family serine peptidase [Clostridium felsineum]